MIKKEKWKKMGRKQKIYPKEKAEILELFVDIYKWEKKMDSDLVALEEGMLKEDF